VVRQKALGMKGKDFHWRTEMGRIAKEKCYEILKRSCRVNAKVIVSAVLSECLSSQLKPDGQTSSANQRHTKNVLLSLFFGRTISKSVLNFSNIILIKKKRLLCIF